jgi:enoyl-CoA hydratase
MISNPDWSYVSITSDDNVAIVKYDRGDSINALSLKGMSELTEAAGLIKSDLSIRAVALIGTNTAFSAGRDLKDPELDGGQKTSLLRRRHIAGAGARLCKAWSELEQFTACGIEGFAIGGGLALAVSVDYRVAGNSAHFRAPEAALGLSMSWGSIPRLVNLIGPARTKQILIHANQRFSAEEAKSWGLIQEIVDDGQAASAAISAAKKASEIPPVPARMIKLAVDSYAGALADAIMHMDTDQVLLAENDQEHLEAVVTFLAKE